MNIDINQALSYYLAFRYIPVKNIGYSQKLIPKYPNINTKHLTGVVNSNDIENFIKDFFSKNIDSTTAILLSGGIDSAILASYLPKNTNAYTIRFIADDAIDESIMAKKYADKYLLNHYIVDVDWNDYIKYAPLLMKNKKAPLHAIEVAVYKASLQAKNDGINKLIIGNGADSNFGGMDKLLSKDWEYHEFIKRYSFCLPENILKEPRDIKHIYEKFRKEDGTINTLYFLNKIHGQGIIQAFSNALELAQITAIEPYECMKLSVPLDIERIRRGQSKYLLKEIFKKRYSDIELPNKIPFARPMEQWLSNWTDTKRKEFREGCLKDLTGDQKWLVYCLEQFLDLNKL